MNIGKRERIILSIGLIVFIIYFGFIVREMMHVVMATMLSGRNIETEYDLLGGKTRAGGLDTSSTRIFLVSGLIGIIIYACLIIVISYNFKNIPLACGAYAVVVINLLEWILSPYIEIGVFYRYLQTDKEMNPAPVIYFLIVILIMVIFLWISTIYKIQENKKIYELLKNQEVK